MQYSGIVQRGSAEAQKLGFPTINIPFDGTESGIFAARVHFDGKEYPAAAYADTKRKIVEAHLIGLDLDLYGKEVEVELLHKVRETIEFKDVEEAQATIAADVQKIREFHRG